MSDASTSLELELTVKRPDEKSLQRSVMEFLDRALPPDAIAHHSPGEGKRSQRAQRDLKHSGYKRGWPDIEIVRKNHPSIFIELKTSAGSLSPDQRAMHRRLEYCGASVLVCRSLPSVIDTLKLLGVPLRGAISA